MSSEANPLSMVNAATRIIERTRKHWEHRMATLTNEELKDITGGLVQGAAQRRWIRKQLGFEPPMKVDGHPMITWEQVNRGKVGNSARPTTGPRWSVAA